MNAMISMDSLWQLIQTLPLDNRKWLSSKLLDDIHEDEAEYISKEEILAGIDAGLKELKLKREGKLKAISADDFLEELRHEVSH